MTCNSSNTVWKRNRSLLYLESVHSDGGELPEMYGITADHLGTDAIGMPIFNLSSIGLGVLVVDEVG